MQAMESYEMADLNHVESGSSSPTILLLHGLNESVQGYLPAMPYLDARLHVFALDFRGHGHSPWSEPYRVQDYSSDVIRFVETTMASPLIVAGHSLGALVAAYISGRRPDLVHGLVLEEPPLYTAQMPTFRETPLYPLFLEVRKLLQAHHDSAGTTEDLEAVLREWQVGSVIDAGSVTAEVSGSQYVSRMALELHQTDPRTLDPTLEGTLFEGFDPDEDLPRIACPTHLIVGGPERGGLLRAEDLERVLSLIPRCSHVGWSDLGHDIHTVRPRAYAQEVLRFVGTIPPLA